MPSSHHNLIFECCKKGKTQQLMDVLSNLENTNIVDERGNTMLCIALKNGHWDTAKNLFENNYTNEPKNPYLISACQSRKDDPLGILLVLKYNENIDVQNLYKRTPLMTACLLGHIKKAQILLKEKASCDLNDFEGNTSLIEAIQSRNKSLVELIIKQSPKVDKLNLLGETALIIALKQKSPIEEIVKQLLSAGSNPEIIDSEQKSAWLLAKQKHPKITKLIEKHLNNINQIELPFFSGLNPPDNKTIKDSLTNTTNTSKTNKSMQNTVVDEKTNTTPEFTNTGKPLVFNHKKAIKSNKQEWFHAARTGNLGGLNRMIIEGVDINCVDTKGCSALIRACGHSRRAVVSFLLQQNADIELRSDNGSTALSSSIIGNCRRVAGLLLEKNANPNGLGPADYSYATIAAAQWNQAMLSILYRSGSDIFITNKHNQNLFHIIALAAEFYNNINGAKSAIQFLHDHGLDINLQDDNGNTALMILCGAHKKDYKVDDRNIASIVHSILKLNAKPALTNINKKSALDAARFNQLQQTKGVLMNALSWNDS